MLIVRRFQSKTRETSVFVFLNFVIFEEFKFRGWYDAAFRLGQETHQILFEFQQTRWASRSKSRSRSEDVSSLAFYRRRIPNHKVHELYAIKTEYLHFICQEAFSVGFPRNDSILTSGWTFYTIARLKGHLIENLNIHEIQKTELRIIANHNADKHQSRRNG